MAKAHVLVVPMPCQGHVTPLMELSHRLVDHGLEVTFVNTEVDHAMVVAALRASGGEAALCGGIRLASIPDGLAGDEDRKDIVKLVDAYTRHMPGHLECLIAELEAAGRPRVKCLVGDVNMGWSFEVARKFGIRVVSFWPAATACFAFMLKIPELIEDGLIDDKAEGPGAPRRGVLRVALRVESTMEGVRNGVPFLCWPYFADQFLDRNYITDVWRTGLAVSPGAGGVVTREELRSKVERVAGDGEIRERARLFRDAARRGVGEGGASYENFRKFVDLLRE
ncbi:putative glucosyl transferase [Panicum miliaceum]|uniref:Glucosyl transferase n=1 Tax=Panicum miliaceum TaxID=4540 RepID=A0A3L6S725_PANMI|nr:putative glucosyl transferase [Panicum miliaceum]